MSMLKEPIEILIFPENVKLVLRTDPADGAFFAFFLT